MFIKRGFFVFSALLLGVLMVPMGAAADSEISFQKTFSSLTPIFMSGHAGDPNWIEGFTGGGDINLDTDEVGTFTVTMTFNNPPMSNTERYDYLSMKVVNTITGMGTFEVNGQALALGSSTFATDGNVTLSWTGSISNSTGDLLGMVGISAGTAQIHMGIFTGSATENLLFRLGY